MIRSAWYCRLMSYIIIALTSSLTGLVTQTTNAPAQMDTRRGMPGERHPARSGIAPDKPPLACASAR